jgi:hypothetical protein
MKGSASISFLRKRQKCLRHNHGMVSDGKKTAAPHAERSATNMINQKNDKVEWAQVLWNFKAGQGEPYPEDASLIERECPYGGIAEIIELEGNFFRLRFGDYIVRANPFSIVKLPKAPLFERNEMVMVDTAKGHSEFQSSVEKIAWHFKETRYYYTLKGKSKHYWEEDLAKI